MYQTPPFQNEPVGIRHQLLVLVFDGRLTAAAHKRALLSVLRAGYLAAFGVLGYALLGRWERIRKQLLRPGTADPARLGLVAYEREHPRTRRHIGFVTVAETNAAVYVALGRWRVLLPLHPPFSTVRPRWVRRVSGQGQELSQEPAFGLSDEEVRFADEQGRIAPT